MKKLFLLFVFICCNTAIHSMQNPISRISATRKKKAKVKCPLCHDKMEKGYQLEHVACHCKENPSTINVSCPYCKESCSSRKSLTRHIRKFHPGAPKIKTIKVPCRFCGRLISKDYQDAHIKFLCKESPYAHPTLPPIRKIFPEKFALPVPVVIPVYQPTTEAILQLMYSSFMCSRYLTGQKRQNTTTTKNEFEPLQKRIKR